MYRNSCKRYSIYLLKQLNFVRLQNRTYQSECVFGFRRRNPAEYQVPEDVQNIRNSNSNFYRLVTAYRTHAHKIADINPIALSRESRENIPELNPSFYGLKESDKVSLKGIISTDKTEGSIKEAVELLNSVYCRTVGAEFSYLETQEEIEWFAETYEKTMQEQLSIETKIRIATELLRSQAFDHFMANKFVSVKRYGGEGAESMMAFFSEFFKLSAQEGLEQIVIGMPHRGRLNFLTGFLNFPPIKIFAKLTGKPDFPAKFEATGDVLSHFISSADVDIDNKSLHISLLYNPSHLEAVNPVSVGKTRAKQLTQKDGDYSKENKWSDKILNLQVHGDAALSGQGVNQETLELSRLPHYEIGGSIHLVVNNQIGFSTEADRGRSSKYCTDLAKIISVPVLHVNGDHPEVVLKAAKIAFAYQRKFRKDVFVDMNCYRQWGHNEVDDPTFTNPAMYKIIHSKRTVPDLYAQKLVNEGIWSEENWNKVNFDRREYLNNDLKKVDQFQPDDPCFRRQWQGYEQAKNVITKWNTGVQTDLLKHVGVKSVSYPKEFNIHPHILKHHVSNRLKQISDGCDIDWSTAEALAIGSLLYQARVLERRLK